MLSSFKNARGLMVFFFLYFNEASFIGESVVTKCHNDTDICITFIYATCQ